MRKVRLSKLAILSIFIANTAFALCGDANFDSKVDSKDLERIKFLTTIDGGPHFMDYSTADVNSDGVIDSRDYMMVRRAVNKSRVLHCPVIKSLVFKSDTALLETRLNQVSFSQLVVDPYAIKQAKSHCFFNPLWDNKLDFYNAEEHTWYYHAQISLGKEMYTPVDVAYCYFKQDFNNPYEVIEAGYWDVQDDHFTYNLVKSVVVVNK